ncbi:ABA4-like family protein [Sphingomonas sp. SUN039]|uniref:ABA4-like family protein n=1 Tax=Sphingomonas sp. SUN039 TaxID=2937787 RepID=UPI0021648163|nr:ABA4-like family protein [Sphingomonas sp. SUN039]UVO52946.1 ABA4-like family protein [Sphingomonas sp. SUN039]
MTLDQIFSLCSLLAFAGWIALLAAPLSRIPLIRGARLLSAALALAYFVQLFTITQPVESGSFSTLAGVSALFSMPGNVMLGWTHFLAFDLFTGAWEVEDAGKIGVPHWAVIVPLVLTFLFGPIGLLTYGAIRTAHRLRTTGRPF